MTSERIPLLLHHARRGVLLASILGVTLHLDPRSADPLAAKGLWFALAAAMIPALAVLRLWWGQPLHLPARRVLIAVGAWVLIAVLAGLLSPLSGLSQASWQAWCLSALLFVGAVDLLHAPEDQAWLLKALVLASLAAGLWVLAQALGLVANPAVFGRRLAGSFGNPNFAAGYFVLMLPLLLWVAAQADQKHWQALALAAAALAALGLGLSGSKAALLGLFASAAVAGHLAFWSDAEIPQKRRFLKVLGVLLGLALLLALSAPATRQRLLGGPAAWAESVAFRSAVWKGSLKAWGQRPLLGQGPGTFSAVYPGHRDPESLKGSQQHAYEVTHAENWLLQMGLEGGLLGLAAALALLLTVLWPLRGLSRGWASSAQASLSLALLSGLLGSLACNLAGLDLYLPSTLLPFLLLLALAVALAKQGAAFSINADPMPRLVVSLGLALGASVPIATAQLQWQGSRLLAEGKVLADGGRYAEAAKKFALAADFHPTNLEARYFLGCALQDQGDTEALKQAEAAFGELRQLAPDYVLVHERLGWLYDAQGRKAEALKAWEWQLALDPYYLPAVKAVVSLAVEAGDLPWAEKVLAESVGRFPADQELAANLEKLRRAMKGRP